MRSKAKSASGGKITLEDLREALRNSWARETSSDPKGWTPENPAWGQCTITACIVQDYFGGKLLRAFFDIIHDGQTLNVSHYWNLLPDNSEIDLTREQFSPDTVVPAGTIKERYYASSRPNRVSRYHILKQRVGKYLEDKEKKVKKKIFLICPVRNITEEEKEKIEQYIENLEKQGHKVYWPVRDTNQDDPIGLRICTDNAKAIIWADEIHIWWQPESEGSKFDFGMAFICYILGSKKIILANPDELVWTDYKSFENVLLALHKQNIKGGKE